MILTKVVHKPKVVILGTGWAGFRFARQIDKSKFDVTLISPRNHFLFTPLLPSTTVGTLEFRCIEEPVRTIPHLKYLQATCEDVHFNENAITCQDTFQGVPFQIPYDYLVVCTGSISNTFNIPGVIPENHVFFLRQLSDARAIRNRLLECFERASTPHVSPEEKKRLLTTVVVGGGPTSIEFAAELYDFIAQDVKSWYPDLMNDVQVILVETSDHILGAFDQRLSDYVTKVFKKREIKILTNTSITQIENGRAKLGDGTVIPYGLVVWSTGIRATKFAEKLDVEKLRNGRIVIDPYLRIPGKEGVFAMGDCAANPKAPLAQLAQVAQQQGEYLANTFNHYYYDKNLYHSLEQSNGKKALKPFLYRHIFSMAAIGGYKAVLDTSHSDILPKVTSFSGFSAFLAWRGGYWTRSVSISNKFLIPMFWFKSWAFGRDISRFQDF